MIGIIFLIIFLSGLIFFGWQIARFAFKINRIELLLPLSLVIGYGVYVFFLNILSYLIFIRLNFYLIFIALLIIAFILFILNKQKPILKSELTKKESVIIFSTVLIVMFLSGLLISRTIGADDLANVHIPAAASIAGGNFPVKDLNLPTYNLVSHYGPCLFYAAISRITGFSILFAPPVTIFLFSGVIFLLIFNIAKLFIKNNKGSFLVALVGMFGGGFRFIYVFNFLDDIYKKFILHYNVEYPFKFLGEAWSVSPLTGSYIANMFHSWTTSVMGYLLLLGIIYLYLKNLISKKWSYTYDLLMIILLSVLALHFEMSFIVLCFGILITPFIIYFKDRNKIDFKALLKHSLLILTITTVFVLFQGGSITGVLNNLIHNKTSYGVELGFSVFRNPLSFISGNGTLFPFYGSTFILSFGLIYFLIIPAIIFIIRKYFEGGVFLTVIGFFSFLVPLVITFNWFWQETLSYFFRLNSLIWAILVGMFLVTILSRIKDSYVSKIIAIICLIVICLEGVIFLVTRPLYKKDEYRLDNNSFFAILRQSSDIESAAYGWIKENSSIKDYFLVFADPKDIDNQVSVLENFRFVVFTQRLAPVYTYSNNNINPALPQDNYYTPIYKRLIFDCANADMETLNYKYLFIDKNWPIGLEEKCLSNNDLELKFKAQEDDNFIRIYKVL